MSNTPAEKKQIASIKQGYQILSEKSAAGEVSPEITAKISHLVDCVCNRNFAGANAIQAVSSMMM